MNTINAILHSSAGGPFVFFTVLLTGLVWDDLKRGIQAAQSWAVRTYYSRNAR